MSTSIHSYGLYRLKIEIKNLIKQFLKTQPKLIRDTDHIDEIYEKIRKEKFKNLITYIVVNNILKKNKIYAPKLITNHYDNNIIEISDLGKKSFYDLVIKKKNI